MFESKQDFRIPILVVARHNRYFAAVGLVYFNLLVPGASDQCREHCHLSQSMAAFVHARKGVGLGCRDGSKLMVINVEAE